MLVPTVVTLNPTTAEADQYLDTKKSYELKSRRLPKIKNVAKDSGTRGRGHLL